MEPFETYEHAGVTVELHYDEIGTSPRELSEGLGVILSFTREFDGDEYLSIEEDLHEQSIGEYVEELREVDCIAVLPLYFADYGSSGARLYEVDPIGDRGRGPNAVIYCTREKAESEDMNAEQVEACLRAEVEEMNSYFQGEVYGYVVNPDDETFSESCWGFIGDDKYVREEANRAAESVAKQLEHERIERCNAACRDIVTV